MIARSKPGRTRPPAGGAHQAFLSLLPAVVRHAQYAFRHYAAEARQEAVEEVLANAFVAFVRLAELKRQHVARPAPLSRYAIAQVCSGRKVGGRLNCRDVLSRYAQQRKNFHVDRLDHSGAAEGEWREIVVEDRRAGPDHVAMVRLDFAAWTDSLSPRDRGVAQLLATGEQTREVALQFDLASSRISQIRAELRESWQKFIGEAGPP